MSEVQQQTTALSSFEKKQSLAGADSKTALEARLAENPRDFGAWVAYLDAREADPSLKVEQVRQLYENCLKVFQTSEEIYYKYIEYEFKQKDNGNVESLYNRSVARAHSVKLWRLYIQYVTSKNNLITGGQEARDVVLKSYEVALRSIGIDLDAGGLWEEYLKFVEQWNPISQWEEQHKVELKRKIYKQCVVIPLHRLEKLWGMYTDFENSSGNITTRKNISEISPSYMLARTWYKQYNNILKAVGAPGLLASKVWINFEKQNKMALANGKQLEARVEFAYAKTLQKYYFYPGIWYDYGQYRLSQGLDVVGTLQEALVLCPYSSVLTYFLAQVYEKKNEGDKIVKLFEDLLDNVIRRYDQLEVDEAYLQKEVARKLEASKRKRPREDDSSDEEDRQEAKAEPADLKAVGKQQKYLANLHLNKVKLERFITNVYINYIKITKRAIKKATARNIFKDARKRFKHLSWHVYYEEAMFEYNTSSVQQNGIKIALKIFDIGMRNLDLQDYKNFPFFVEYFKFLILVNDYTNIKSLFEVCINSLTKVGSTKANKTLKVLFKMLLRYELYNGNLLSLQNLQARYKETFPDDAHIYIFSQIYKEYDGLDLIKEFEIDVNSNDLFNKVLDYDSNINSILYGNKPVVSRKIKQSKLLENYGNSDDEYTDDLENYGFRVAKKEDNDEYNLDEDYDPLEIEEEEIVVEKDDSGPFVTDNIYNLLRILPSSTNFEKSIFDSEKLVGVLQTL